MAVLFDVWMAVLFDAQVEVLVLTTLGFIATFLTPELFGPIMVGNGDVSSLSSFVSF